MLKPVNLLGHQVNVIYDSQQLSGYIIREDQDEPFVTIIQLEDGRVVLSTECVYSIAPVIGPCLHAAVKCTSCGNVAKPAQFMALKKRVRSPEAAGQSRQAAKKGGWPKGKPRKS